MVRYFFDKNLKRIKTLQNSSSSASDSPDLELDFFSIVIHTSIAENSAFFETESIEYFIIPEDEQIKTFNIFDENAFEMRKNNLESSLEILEAELANIKRRQKHTKCAEHAIIRVAYYLGNEDDYNSLYQATKMDKFQEVRLAKFYYIGRYSSIERYKALLDTDLSVLDQGGKSRDITVQLVVLDWTRKNIFIPDTKIIIIDPRKVVQGCNNTTGRYYKKQTLISFYEFNLMTSLGNKFQPRVIFLGPQKAFCELQQFPKIQLD